MESNMESVKESLSQIKHRSLKGESDCFTITEQQTWAIINGSVPSTINNAIVAVKTKNFFDEWEVKKSKVIRCPKPIHIGIKNMNVIAGCIGDEEKEASFFKIKKTQNIQSEILSICAVIEVDECSIAFYYNSETNESYYIAQSSYGKESTDLFVIAKYLRNLEVMHDEEQYMQWNGLEKVETAEVPLWLENASQWQ